MVLWYIHVMWYFSVAGVWCGCGGVVEVVWLCWCSCGGVVVVVWLWWCGGAGVVVVVE